ncbi:MAG: DUF642 domain-containing protein [Phycisphaeraceae bacterium]|nr:DUF642 domain-containing protein [Phycisphaeraceae bacterium]
MFASSAARACVLALFVPPLALIADAQNIVINGSFEAPDAGSGFTNRSGSFGAGSGWSIGNNIDHIGGFWAAADGSQSVDLNGSSAGSVSQALATIPGRTYRLRYAVSENFFGYEDKTMLVTWNGATVENIVIAHDPTRTTIDVKWQYRSMNVGATGTSSTLAFISTTGAQSGAQGVAPFYGPAIDDVSVELAAGCPGDLNNDQFVDDSDFVIFVSAYNILDCADASMPPGCPADLSGDGFVDDADFVMFIAAYNELLCP